MKSFFLGTIINRDQSLQGNGDQPPFEIMNFKSIFAALLATCSLVALAVDVGDREVRHQGVDFVLRTLDNGGTKITFNAVAKEDNAFFNPSFTPCSVMEEC